MDGENTLRWLLEKAEPMLAPRAPSLSDPGSIDESSIC
jgi:hypothetical protein